jgi:hypothetical protein
MPLRGTGDVEGAAHRKVLPLVREEMQLFGIEEAAGFAIANEGVVRIGIPETAHDVDELLRPGVSVGVGEVALAAEVPGLARVGGGDEVPARAAAAQMIEGGELARDVERFVVGRGRSCHEADAFGDRREVR